MGLTILTCNDGGWCGRSLYSPVLMLMSVYWITILTCIDVGVGLTILTCIDVGVGVGLTLNTCIDVGVGVGGSP